MTLPHANDGNGRLVAAHHKEEYDEIARALLKERKFDPEDFNQRNEFGVTPMTYYCDEGNITMCQYLIAGGADCREVDLYGRCPMFAAAEGGHVEILKLLCQDGCAPEDIGRVVDRNGPSPLFIALRNGHVDVWKWLIRNGALSSSTLGAVNDGSIDDAIMRRDLCQIRNWRDKRLPILAWAQTLVAAYANVHVFLTGTILSASSSVCRPPKTPYATRSHKRRKGVSPSSSPLVIFNGKSGILELIAHYSAGTPQELRTLRQLVNLLPAFIADVPTIVEEDEGDEVDRIRRMRRRRSIRAFWN